MSEANASVGGMRGGIHPLMGMPRPGPYDRGDRYSMGMGGMGYGGRGRNLKGTNTFGNVFIDISHVTFNIFCGLYDLQQ